MLQYSEDRFLNDDCPLEAEQNEPGVWKTNHVSLQRLAKLQNYKLTAFLKKGYNFERIYWKLMKHEIQVKVNHLGESTPLNNRLKECRKEAIIEKYNFKYYSYVAADLEDQLYEFFYRILKEKFYSLQQFTTIANILGLALQYSVYLDWYENY